MTIKRKKDDLAESLWLLRIDLDELIRGVSVKMVRNPRNRSHLSYRDNAIFKPFEIELI